MSQSPNRLSNQEKDGLLGALNVSKTDRNVFGNVTRDLFSNF